MTDEEIMIKDPMGTDIFLLPQICFPEIEKDKAGIYDDLAAVISKPAILIEHIKDEEKRLYYFRSIGWHNTILLEIIFKNERWETAKCTRNPSNEVLLELLKKGKQLL